MSDFPCHQKSPFCYSELWHKLIQCFHKAVHMDGHPGHSASVTHELPFLTCQSIQIHFTSVKHCSHTVLRVFFNAF